MIPTKLRLKNFLSYQDASIDLEGIRLACICGNNGAGKSALLDALTWALWGRARSGIHHDALINLGQNEMEVELEFLLEKQRYRVIRKYARPTPTRQARHLLDLQIASEQGFRSISENTIKETEKKIEKLLHLDYQTFINSTLLLQGRADEFTKKTPAERKEVLGKILGLEFYDLLAEKAKELWREKKKEQEKLNSEIAQLKTEIDKIPQYQKELEEAQEERSRLELKRLEQENILSELRQCLNQLILKEHRLKELEERRAALIKEIDDWLKEKQKLASQLQEIRKLLDRSPQIEEGYLLFIKTRKKEEELATKWHQWHKLEQEKRGLENIIQQARNELEREKDRLSFQVDEIKKRSAMLPMKERELKLIEGELCQLEWDRQSLARKKETFWQLSSELQSLEGEERQKKQELKELEEKARLLSKDVVNCPLCGTKLGPEGIKHLREEFKSKRKEIDRRLIEIGKEKDKLVQETQKLQQEFGKEEELNYKLSQKLGEKASLEKEIWEIKDKGRMLAEIEGELSRLKVVLNEGRFATEARGGLREIERQLKELAYDFGEHEEARRRLKELRDWEDEKRRLEVGWGLLPGLEDSLKKAQKQLEEGKLKCEELESQKSILLKEIGNLSGVREELGKAEEVYRCLRSDQLACERCLAVAQEKLNRAHGLKRDKEQKEQELSLVEEEEKIYEDLAEAFGKKGVQALLIEQALPVLEEEADRLVKKLTDNRMGLCFRPQKITREGKVVETLEIKIGDELGTRNYEMYSGGEAFRIDFALRVALAKMVARRSGAPLPVLIIDEGFGSQDKQGRERLAEAIKAVADEFEMVLVITHIDEFKEHFPARIEVTKTDQGSVVQVVV